MNRAMKMDGAGTASPLAAEGSVHVAGCARFSVLTEGIVQCTETVRGNYKVHGSHQLRLECHGGLPVCSAARTGQRKVCGAMMDEQQRDGVRQ